MTQKSFAFFMQIRQFSLCCRKNPAFGQKQRESFYIQKKSSAFFTLKKPGIFFLMRIFFYILRKFCFFSINNTGIFFNMKNRVLGKIPPAKMSPRKVPTENYLREINPPGKLPPGKLPPTPPKKSIL